MRRLSLLLLTLLPLAAFGQIRTGSDITSGNFAIGIDNYLRLSSSSDGKAAFDFSWGGKAFKAIAEEGTVSVGESRLLVGYAPVAASDPKLEIPAFAGKPEMIIGIHDFSADKEPELVIALRDLASEGLVVYVFAYQNNSWKGIGTIAAFGPEVCECRIFRQVITIEAGGNLYTWTYRGGRFAFRSSTGSKDPASLLPR